MRPRAGAVLAGAAVVLLALSGCSAQDSLAQQAREGGSKNFVAGDGSVTVVDVADRADPVELTGETTDGAVDLADWRGDVVVLNVWFAACGPCIAEAPDLAEISTEYAPDGVRFLGINTRDGADTARAFERRHGIEYPSALDADTGQALLALRGSVPPQAIPTTLVLDGEGRVAARMLGVAEPSTLRALIDDALAENV